MEYDLKELILKAFRGTMTADEREYYLAHYMSTEEKQIGKPYFEMTRAEQLEYDRLCFNNKAGNLKGYNCPICKNKGEIMMIKDGIAYYPDCSCMKIRRSLANMEKSGLGNLLNIYTFDKYKCTYDWQKHAYDKAKEFITSDKNFFVMSGQSGAGKSHLCTAVAGELLKQGIELKYMLWLDESIKIKQVVNDSKQYGSMIEELKNIPALYIDDFLKTEKGGAPTSADIRLANEIINYRYNKCRADKSQRYITIISTEWLIKQINGFDEALAGRICEMARPDYLLQIVGDGKNYRMNNF